MDACALPAVFWRHSCFFKSMPTCLQTRQGMHVSVSWASLPCCSLSVYFSAIGTTGKDTGAAMYQERGCMCPVTRHYSSSMHCHSLWVMLRAVSGPPLPGLWVSGVLVITAPFVVKQLFSTRWFWYRLLLLVQQSSAKFALAIV